MKKETAKRVEEIRQLICDKTTSMEELEKQRDEKEKAIEDFEIDPDDYAEGFEEMLDECYPQVFNIDPSRILKEMDPIAYHQELLAYVDGVDKEDNPDYSELKEELQELEEEYDLREEEIADLKGELIGLVGEDEATDIWEEIITMDKRGDA